MYYNYAYRLLQVAHTDNKLLSLISLRFPEIEDDTLPYLLILNEYFCHFKVVEVTVRYV